MVDSMNWGNRCAGKGQKNSFQTGPSIGLTSDWWSHKSFKLRGRSSNAVCYLIFCHVNILLNPCSNDSHISGIVKLQWLGFLANFNKQRQPWKDKSVVRTCTAFPRDSGMNPWVPVKVFKGASAACVRYWRHRLVFHLLDYHYSLACQIVFFAIFPIDPSLFVFLSECYISCSCPLNCSFPFCIPDLA